MEAQLAVQQLLRSHLARVQSQNSHYSLRAFAKRLGMNPGALSGIINGRRTVSAKLAEKVARKLNLDPQEKMELLAPFLVRKQKLEPAQASDLKSLEKKYYQISASQFRVISEWVHFAILSLLEVRGFSWNAIWIAKRLGLPTNTVSQAMTRLVDLGLVKTVSPNRAVRTKEKIRTPDDIADSSIQKAHEQTLELAKESLLKDSVEIRDFTSITMPVDPHQLDKAKEIIRRFQDELSAVLEQGEKTEVYRFATALFPLSKKEIL